MHEKKSDVLLYNRIYPFSSQLNCFLFNHKDIKQTDRQTNKQINEQTNGS